MRNYKEDGIYPIIEINKLKYRGVQEPAFGNSIYFTLSDNKIQPITIQKNVILPKRRIRKQIIARPIKSALKTLQKPSSRLKRIMKVTPKVKENLEISKTH